MRTRKAVITAAGRGTRMFPATRAVQKELLPLIDRDGLCKPTIQVIIEDCIASGIEEICVVVEKGGEGPFRDHFRGFTAEERPIFASKPDLFAAGEKLGAISERISYVEQPSPEGFGHAVYQTKEWVGDDSFVLLLGDHVYTAPPGRSSPIAQLIDAGASTGGSVTGVLLEPESEVHTTGVLKCVPRDPSRAADAPGQTYEILTLKEKPSAEDARQNLHTDGIAAGRYLAHFGIHLFTPEIFDCLGHLIANNLRVKNEFQLTSGQELLLERSRTSAGRSYSAAFLDASRWDIGKPDVYLESLAAYGARGPYAERLRAVVDRAEVSTIE